MCLCNYLNKQQMLYVIHLFLINFLLTKIVSSEKIYFPDDVHNFKIGDQQYPKHQDYQGKQTKRNSVEDEDGIPMDMIQKLNEIQNVSQLYEEFVIEDNKKNVGGGMYGMASRLRTSPYTSDKSDGVEDEVKVTRVGSLERSPTDAITRSANLKFASPAVCKPELQIIELYESDDRKIFAFPSCTRVERCGGCCQHELLSCQPTQVEIINYQVLLMQYGGGNQLKPLRREIVAKEKHTQCKCSCVTKESDCSPLQEYREHECKCVCTNTDEENKCSLESENKLWDPHSCSCKCRNIVECSSGHYFSESSCLCESRIWRTPIKYEK